LGFVFIYPSSLKKDVIAFCKRKEYAFVFSRYLSPLILIPSGIKRVADIDDDFIELYTSRIKQASSRYKRLRLRQIQLINQSIYKKLLMKLDLAIVVKKENLPIPQLIMENLPFQSLLNKDYEFHTSTCTTLLFVGKLTYEPNVLGLSWFLKDVFPRLLAEVPNLTLQVVSNEHPRDEQLLSLLNGVNIKVNYKAPDLNEFYALSSVVIAPIFQGAGSNLKVVEGICHGRPLVSTKFGSKSFEKESNLGFILSVDSPDAMVSTIFQLLSRPIELAILQEKIYAWAAGNYSLDQWNKKLLNAI
jgi:glycosyltransferase involved in cell wall biosynthesis